MKKKYSININKISNLIFFISLFIALFSNMVVLSMIPATFSPIVLLLKYLKYVVIFLLLIKIIFLDKRTPINLLMILSIAIVFLITGKMAGNQDILTSYLLVAGVKNINLKKVFKFTFFLTLGMLILVIFGSLVKLLPNLVYSRNGLKRVSLGTCYPTALSSWIFFNCSAFVCYRILNNSDKNNFISFVYVLLSSFVLYKLTNTRTDFICMILISALLFWRNYKNFMDFKSIKIFISLFPTIIFGWTLLSTYFFDIHNKVWLKLNDMFSGRLSLNKMASKHHPAKFLGQTFEQIGNGGTTKITHHYFFIDSSFARVLFMNGILSFIILYLLFQILFIRIIRKDNSMYNALLLVLMISMIEAVFSADGLMIIDSSLFILSLGLSLRKMNNDENVFLKQT